MSGDNPLAGLTMFEIVCQIVGLPAGAEPSDLRKEIERIIAAHSFDDAEDPYVRRSREQYELALLAARVRIRGG